LDESGLGGGEIDKRIQIRDGHLTMGGYMYDNIRFVFRPGFTRPDHGRGNSIVMRDTMIALPASAIV
jgi:hypothetical protein